MPDSTLSAGHHTTGKFDWKDRGRAAGLHLGISLAIGVLAAVLVFVLWFPWPYREISGGRDLFLLVVSVDVVLGPLITFAIFNRAKPRQELRRDLAIVGLLQLLGLAYGLWTVQLARPVHLVFEFERFRVVHAADVPEDLLDKIPAGIDGLPLTGPTLLAVRPFVDERERMYATMVAIQAGIAVGARPDFWQSYEAAKPRVLKELRPIADLQQRFPQQAAEIDKVLQASGRKPEQAAYLPMIARKATAWTVVLDARTAEVLGYVPVDSF